MVICHLQIAKDLAGGLDRRTDHAGKLTIFSDELLDQ
jgi:hypothetical protein